MRKCLHGLTARSCLTDLGGTGCLIAVDRLGNTEMTANCATMPRGWKSNDGRQGAAIRM
ncbi:hypothetical protein [Dyadobacter fermentans]|uniref:hypothetical protein n=1 Tax=Dyadobacter fermentans TaxID=94254 RepID=UPI00019B5BD1|nr:hypothetical protein [Dyadobacter fermentans]